MSDQPQRYQRFARVNGLPADEDREHYQPAHDQHADPRRPTVALAFLKTEHDQADTGAGEQDAENVHVQMPAGQLRNQPRRQHQPENADRCIDEKIHRQPS